MGALVLGYRNNACTHTHTQQSRTVDIENESVRYGSSTCGVCVCVCVRLNENYDGVENHKAHVRAHSHGDRSYTRILAPGVLGASQPAQVPLMTTARREFVCVPLRSSG